MDDWVRTGRIGYALAHLASSEQEQAVVPLHVTRNGDARVSVYNTKEQARAAAEACEEDVVPIPIVTASPLDH